MQRLEAARATWEASDIQNYRLVVHPTTMSDYLSNFSITVRGGRVVEAGTASSLNFDGTFDIIKRNYILDKPRHLC